MATCAGELTSWSSGISQALALFQVERSRRDDSTETIPSGFEVNGNVNRVDVNQIALISGLGTPPTFDFAIEQVGELENTICTGAS
jgi:hypothetical protein